MYIKVDHKKMIRTAEQIDSYISNLDKKMKEIDLVVSSVGAEWKGEDYRQVKTEWVQMNSHGSTTDKMKISLKSYSGAIREAAKLYKEAQTRAINRAKTLCK